MFSNVVFKNVAEHQLSKSLAKYMYMCISLNKFGCSNCTDLVGQKWGLNQRPTQTLRKNCSEYPKQSEMDACSPGIRPLWSNYKQHSLFRTI